jgi:5-methylcytosine-specific restriction endonuclease McrA
MSNSNEYMRVYMLERARKRRQEALDRLGGKCNLCGSTDQLELDHIDRTTKKYTVARIYSYSEKTFWEEVEKCQILCRKCHIFKSKNDISDYQLNQKIKGKSKYRGVFWLKDCNKWGAQFQYRGTIYRLGRFLTEEEASEAYENKRKEVLGEA